MDDLWQKIQSLVGPQGYLTGQDVLDRSGWGDYQVNATRLVRPADTQQVAEVVKLCHQGSQTIVLHGGRTGLVGGCNATDSDIILSLERMAHISTEDASDGRFVVQAGAILEDVQNQANHFGMRFGVDLGARGSASIGGLIATNAGGNSVIRLGMMRNHVLGLEAVLADGTVISSMNTMLKNNAGYDIKQLFIGSEGTLGIVTQAVLKLEPAPTALVSALIACASFEQVTALLKLSQARLNHQLSTFEVMWQSFYQCTVPCLPTPPLADGYPFYVLIECESFNQEELDKHFDDYVAEIMQRSLISDAVIAQSLQQRDNFWRVRDNIEALQTTGPVVTFDVSLPLKYTYVYICEVQDALAQLPCDSPVTVFGHLGDGNLHISVPMKAPSTKLYQQILEEVYNPLAQYGGSISGEHGIGTEKIPYLHLSRSPTEIALMRQLKQTLDPKSILNPSKVIPAG